MEALICTIKKLAVYLISAAVLQYHAALLRLLQLAARGFQFTFSIPGAALQQIQVGRGEQE